MDQIQPYSFSVIYKESINSCTGRFVHKQEKAIPKVSCVNRYLCIGQIFGYIWVTCKSLFLACIDIYKYECQKILHISPSKFINRTSFKMFEINEEVHPKKQIRDKKSLSAGNGISNMYVERHY